MFSHLRFALLATVATVSALAVLTSASSHVSANDGDASSAQTPQSTITFRFVRDGEPVEVTNWSIVASTFADGVACSSPHADEVLTTSSERIEVWPNPSPYALAECKKAPPVTVGFQFAFATVDGNFVVTPTIEFLWTGADMTVDLEIPPELDLTATPRPVYPQYSIFFQFYRDEEKVSIDVIDISPRTYVGNVDCTLEAAISGTPGRTKGGLFWWPSFPGDVDPACLEGPPTTIRYEFLREGAPMVIEVEWLGDNMDVDFEVPASIEVFLVPTPIPGLSLPFTGGAPHEDSPRWPLVLGLALMGAAAGAWLLRRAVREG